MTYPSSFKHLLEIASRCQETYIGYGNPNSQILYIANEPGSVSDDILELDIKRNFSLWQKNVEDGFDRTMLLDVFEDDKKDFWKRFNPLHPYYHQHYVQAVFKKGCEIPINDDKKPTSRLFKQYQKLTDFIYNANECKLTQDDYIDFFNSAFIMDFSSVAGASSKDINPQDRLNSINRRIDLFKSKFMQSFPIIIVASGHYIKMIPILNDLTQIFDNYKYIGQEPGWLNIHKRIDGKGILIHCKHLSHVSDEYLIKIADLCRPFLCSE